jgi:integrase/recombinase XerD
MPGNTNDFQPALIQFQRYLEDNGFRKSTIDSYLDRAGRYLQFAETNRPLPNTLDNFREILHTRHLSRSTINNYCISIKAYHKMHGEDVSFPFLKLNEGLPYYFNQDDIGKIFSLINNFKHYTMLNVLFYGCLRASELCSLNIEDVDLNALTIRITEGKGGREAMVCINNHCATILKRYLAIRPRFEIEGQQPLFYTDYGTRWDRSDLYRVFEGYKRKAGIEKRGGLHVFARHTPATIMIANGCDIRIVKEVLRHKDIRTTLRYAHVSDKTKREKYEQYLTLQL